MHTDEHERRAGSQYSLNPTQAETEVIEELQLSYPADEEDVQAEWIPPVISRADSGYGSSTTPAARTKIEKDVEMDETPLSDDRLHFAEPLDWNTKLPETPPEIESLARINRNGTLVQLIVSSSSPLLPWKLPGDIRYVWAGLFRVDSVKVFLVTNNCVYTLIPV